MSLKKIFKMSMPDPPVQITITPDIEQGCGVSDNTRVTPCIPQKLIEEETADFKVIDP